MSVVFAVLMALWALIRISSVAFAKFAPEQKSEPQGTPAKK
jgi:Na+-transporting methylmalonyl-CoA/oxaloacetate decarboxylase gamma subunit